MANKMVVVVPIVGLPFYKYLAIVIRAITTTKLSLVGIFSSYCEVYWTQPAMAQTFLFNN